MVKRVQVVDWPEKCFIPRIRASESPKNKKNEKENIEMIEYWSIVIATTAKLNSPCQSELTSTKKSAKKRNDE